MLLRLDSQWADASTLRLGSQWQAESEPLMLVADIDGGNVSAALSEVFYGYSDEPEVEIDFRAAAITGTNGSGWRQALFRLDNASGKRPIFRVNRSNRSNTAAPSSEWRPLWTTDFETWHRHSERPDLSSGSSGYFEWQFDVPFAAETVYVATNPIKPNSYAAVFADELLTDYSTVAGIASSADENGVYAVTPAETDENDRPIGENPQYAIALAWPGPTTDGKPKRKLVVFAGIHSQGEQSSWIPFEASVRWMLDNASPEADDFRSNWDVWLYFNVTPNGITGGHRRHNFRQSTDPNRAFRLTATPPLKEIEDLQNAVLADTGGEADAMFSWHGYSSATRLFIPGTLSGPNAATQAFIDKGVEVFGVGEYLSYFNGVNNYDFWWGYEKLGCKIAFAAEVPQSGRTDIASHELIGVGWMEALQLTDADGWFDESVETLDIHSSTHGHAATAPTLTALHNLVTASATHSHAADGIQINSGLQLDTSDATHAHGSDNLVLTTALALAIQAAQHGHTASALGLAASLTLAVDAAQHDQSADNITFAAGATLNTAHATHNHLAESLALSSVVGLSIDSATHQHAADSLALAAALNLLVSDALHAQLADTLTLDTSNAANLETHNAAHDHSAQSLGLSATLGLASLDATHAQLAQTPTLSAHHNMAFHDASHGHTADNLEANSGIVATIHDSFHGHVADGLELDTALALAIHDAIHAHNAEALELGSLVNLAINDAMHALTDSGLRLFIPSPITDELRRSVFARLIEQHVIGRLPAAEQAMARLSSTSTNGRLQ